MTESIRALHVDDDPDFADLAVAFLERDAEDVAVETATSAAEGLDRLAEDEFDCVVSDYDMPGRNGVEFLEAVREHHPDLPFILFTGKGSEEVASEAISAGVTDYLQKEGGPHQFTVLANKIRHAVAQYRTRRALREEERIHAALFNEFPEPTVAIEFVDREPIVRDVNQAFESTFGFDAEAATGRSINDLIVPEDEREAASRIDERALAGDPLDEVIRRMTVDGPRTFLLRSIPVDGEIDFYGVYEDLTALRELHPETGAGEPLAQDAEPE